MFDFDENKTLDDVDHRDDDDELVSVHVIEHNKNPTINFFLFNKIIIVTYKKTMKIDIPKFLLFVTMTTATAVAADSSSSTLARNKVTIEEGKSLSNNGEGATTPPPPEEFAGSTLASSSSMVKILNLPFFLSLGI